jgi:OOP family OmpA-OmpF porin
MLTKIFMTLTILFTSFVTHAQIWKDTGKKLEKKLEQKSSQRLERKMDRAIDKSLDKVEEAPEKANKKNKAKKAGNTQNDTEEAAKAPTQVEEPAKDQTDAAEAEKNGSKNAKNTSEELADSSTPPLQRYNKFTFVQGEKIIAFDDFSQDAVGDLPASWVSTGTSEIVKFDHVEGNWVWFNKTKGNFVPEYLKDFPENFTLEFDLMYDFDFKSYSHSRQLALILSDISHPEAKLDWNGDPGYFYLQPLSPNYFAIDFDSKPSNGGPYITGRKAVTANKDLNFSAPYNAKELINAERKNIPIHISISRTGRRIQVFANEIKALDITNAFEKDVKLSSARFYISNFTETDHYYISNIRYAVGKPDTRNKLLASGTFTTSAITFNSGSAQIKSESYGILKEIADALKSEPSKAVTIVGHTDSDGSDAHNKQLSEKRAKAVRQALMQEFDVKNNMSTEGKGESAPIADNSTPSGKAQNRRVDFILI